MEDNYKVSFAKVIDKFGLEVIYLPDLPEKIMISCTRVNRLGLQMVGFYDHYEKERLQIVGKVENLFISQLAKEERDRRLEDFFRSSPVGVIVTSSIEISQSTIDLAEKYAVPLLRTKERTSEFMAALIAYLNVELGPRITRHGVLVEVYGCRKERNGYRACKKGTQTYCGRRGGNKESFSHDACRKSP